MVQEEINSSSLARCRVKYFPALRLITTVNVNETGKGKKKRFFVLMINFRYSDTPIVLVSFWKNVLKSSDITLTLSSILFHD